MANPQSRAFIIRDGTETLKITQKSNSLRSIGESEPSLSKIMHSSVTEELLTKITGTNDLSTVTKLEICIDTSETSGSAIGDYLPSLLQLRLNNSVLSSFRDLGTSLKQLQILYASRCGLTDLDGINLLPNLTELYLAFNNIEDVSPLALHDTLEVLDLEGNKLCDENSLVSLSMVPRLHTLTLEGNPIALESTYRELVAANVHQVTILDDEPLEHMDDDEDDDDNNSNIHKKSSQTTSKTPQSTNQRRNYSNTNDDTNEYVSHSASSSGGKRVATSASDPLCIQDSDSKLNSPEHSPSSSSNHHKYSVIPTATSPTKSHAFIHEEYTIAQALRSKANLSTDPDFLLTGRTSPTEEDIALLNNHSVPNHHSQPQNQRYGFVTPGGKEADEDDDDFDQSRLMMNNSRPATASSFGSSSLPNTNSRPGSSNIYPSMYRPGTGRSIGSINNNNYPNPLSSSSSTFDFLNPNYPNPVTVPRPTTATTVHSTSSDLTHGDDAVVLAGGLATALRRKRNNSSSVPQSPINGREGGFIRSRHGSEASFSTLGTTNETNSFLDTSTVVDMNTSFRSTTSDVPRYPSTSALTINTNLPSNRPSSSSGIANNNVSTPTTTGGLLSSSTTAIPTVEPPSWFLAAQMKAGISRPGTANANPNTSVRRPVTPSSTSHTNLNPEFLSRLGLDTSITSIDDDDDDNEDSKEEEASNRPIHSSTLKKHEYSNIMEAFGEARKEDEKTKKRAHDEMRAMRQELKSANGRVIPPPPMVSLSISTQEETKVNEESGSNIGTSVNESLSSTVVPYTPGPALSLTDDELIFMLKQKPKNVPQLHSRDSFRRFFAGISRTRMILLLNSAYADCGGLDIKKEKVDKRMELLTGILKE